MRTCTSHRWVPMAPRWQVQARPTASRPPYSNSRRPSKRRSEVPTLVVAAATVLSKKVSPCGFLRAVFCCHHSSFIHVLLPPLFSLDTPRRRSTPYLAVVAYSRSRDTLQHPRRRSSRWARLLLCRPLSQAKVRGFRRARYLSLLPLVYLPRRNLNHLLFARRLPSATFVSPSSPRTDLYPRVSPLVHRSITRPTAN